MRRGPPTWGPATTNRWLRALATILQTWRKGGLLPHLHSDDIRDRLEQLKVDREPPNPLCSAQIRALVRACLDHDRAAVRGARPIAPFTVAVLLGGFRLGEALALQWEWVDLEVGIIRLPPTSTKTRTGRRVTLAESPALAAMLASMRGEGLVFGQTESGVQLARARLIRRYGAPAFTWQQLRQTSSAYAWCMAEAIPFRAAKRMGHSVTVAESRYADLVEVAAGARTLEHAMGVEKELGEAVSFAERE